MVRSQPAGSAGDPGRQERHSQTEGMSLIRQRGCWHQGRTCPTKYEVLPSSTVSRSRDVCYLGKAHFMAKINNEMSSTSIPSSLFRISGETTANGALPDSDRHKPECVEVPPQGFRSQGGSSNAADLSPVSHQLLASHRPSCLTFASRYQFLTLARMSGSGQKARQK